MLFFLPVPMPVLILPPCMYRWMYITHGWYGYGYGYGWAVVPSASQPCLVLVLVLVLGLGALQLSRAGAACRVSEEISHTVGMLRREVVGLRATAAVASSSWLSGHGWTRLCFRCWSCKRMRSMAITLTSEAQHRDGEMKSCYWLVHFGTRGDFLSCSPLPASHLVFASWRGGLRVDFSVT